MSEFWSGFRATFFNRNNWRKAATWALLGAWLMAQVQLGLAEHRLDEARSALSASRDSCADLRATLASERWAREFIDMGFVPARHYFALRDSCETLRAQLADAEAQAELRLRGWRGTPPDTAYGDQPGDTLWVNKRAMRGWRGER